MHVSVVYAALALFSPKQAFCRCQKRPVFPFNFNVFLADE